jgi:hypothetical protein
MAQGKKRHSSPKVKARLPHSQSANQSHSIRGRGWVSILIHIKSQNQEKLAHMAEVRGKAKHGKGVKHKEGIRSMVKLHFLIWGVYEGNDFFEIHCRLFCTYIILQ